jgi:hypothetical protein
VLTVDHLGCLGEVAGACIGQVTGMWKVVAFPFLARCTLANAGLRWLTVSLSRELSECRVIL